MNYITSPAEAEEFFLRVMKLKEDTLENRIKILEEMAKECKMLKQTDDQVKRRIAGKKVLHVKPKPDLSN